MELQTAQYWIETLDLKAHPEGGFYKENYRSDEKIQSNALPKRFPDDRCVSTAIYFLLRSEDRSVFHRIKSDEIWHFYDGSPLSIYVLDEIGVHVFKLGRDVAAGESPQVIVPAGKWFGAKVNDANSFTLSGCTVAPGFDYHDFEMADRADLLKTFPTHRDIIEKLT